MVNSWKQRSPSCLRRGEQAQVRNRASQSSCGFVPLVLYTSSSPNPCFVPPHFTLPTGNHYFVLCICESISLLLYSFALCFQILHIINNVQYLFFSDSFHLAYCPQDPFLLLQKISFIFIAEQYSTVYIHHVFLGYCYILAIINNAVFLNKHTNAQFLDDIVVEFLFFEDSP